MKFLHPAMWHDHVIDFARWLHPAMWHVTLESWQWIHQVAAPCKVTRGSAMTCHWFRQVTAPCNVACDSGIVTVNSPSGSTLQSDTWLCDDMSLNSPGGSTLQCGSGMTCHWIRTNYTYWNSTDGFGFDHITTVDMSFCTRLWNFMQIGPLSAEKNDDMSIFKMANLSHLGSYGSNNGFFEKPNYITSYRSSLDTIALNCLFFEKIAFLHFDDRQTNKQTDGQHRCTKPLSLSRAAT